MLASSFETKAGAKLLAPILGRDTEPGSLADSNSLSLPSGIPCGARRYGAHISSEAPLVNMEAKYRALVEQIPAVIFMAYLDQGIGEAYVSPQIEEALEDFLELLEARRVNRQAATTPGSLV